MHCTDGNFANPKAYAWEISVPAPVKIIFSEQNLNEGYSEDVLQMVAIESR